MTPRLAPYIAGALLLFGAWLWYRGELAKADAAGFERARAQMQRQVEIANFHAQESEDYWRTRAEELDLEHQANLERLDREYRERPLPAIRMCKPAADRGRELPAGPNAAGGDHGAAGADGLSRDLAPDLQRLARDADEQTARLIACQQYVRAIQH